MYEKYCGSNGWKFRIMSVSDGDVGGFREATAVVEGDDCFARLRFEGGVHRVQRKPVTDRTRVHTSTTTVAVLPAAPEVENSDIPESELLVETYRARGAGGQHVNTTDSAIRVTHLPTGIVVAIQDDRSQHRNKAQAMQLIKAKVYDLRRTQLERERASSRRTMIGTGDRSERIRTYNFPQDRVTDHRIGFTETGVDAMMAGTLLPSFVEKLREFYTKQRIEEYLKQN